MGRKRERKRDQAQDLLELARRHEDALVRAGLSSAVLDDLESALRRVHSGSHVRPLRASSPASRSWTRSPRPDCSESSPQASSPRMSLDLKGPAGLSEPVTGVAQLVEYFRSAEKPRSEWRVGVEHEKIGIV